MERIIWKVRFAGSSSPEPGELVTCLWDRGSSVYDVYYRGRLCGVVDEKFRDGRPEADFLTGRVLNPGGGHAKICIRRGRNRARMAAGIPTFLRAAA